MSAAPSPGGHPHVPGGTGAADPEPGAGAGGMVGEIDLRLMPAALLAWLGALVAVRVPHAVGLATALAALVAAAVATARLRTALRARHRDPTRTRAAAAVLLAAVVLATTVLGASARADERSARVAPHLQEAVLAELQVAGEPRARGDPAQGAVVTVTWRAVHEDRLTGVPGAGAVAAGAVAGSDTGVPPAWSPAEGDADAAGSAGSAGSVGDAGSAVGVPAVLLVTDAAAWDAVMVGERVLIDARVAPTAAGDSAAALLVASGRPVPYAAASRPATVVADLRAGLRDAVVDRSPDIRGLVPGIALGDDRQLPEATRAAMQTVSLTHITAVSGAHVAMVLGLVLAALARVPVPVRAVVGAAVLAGLVALVHPSPSVVRAAAMGAVLLLGSVLGRPRAALPALWAGVIGLLLWDPWLAGEIGFGLSVAATAGLLLWTAPLAAWLGKTMPRPLAIALAVPLAAQLACLPLLTLVAPQLPVHGVLANAMAAPAVPSATVLGLLATLVHPVAPGLAEALATAAGWATSWIAEVARWCASLPIASAPWWTAAAGAAGCVVLVLWRRRPPSGRRTRFGVGPL